MRSVWRASLVVVCVLLNALVLLYPIAMGDRSLVPLSEAAVMPDGAHASKVERRGAALFLHPSEAPVQVVVPTGGHRVTAQFSTASTAGNCIDPRAAGKVQVAIKDGARPVDRVAIGAGEAISRTYDAQSGELTIAATADRGSCTGAMVAGELSRNRIGLRYVIAYVALFLLGCVFAYELVRQGYAWYCGLFYLGVLLFSLRPDIVSDRDGSLLLAQMLFVAVAVWAVAVLARSRIGFLVPATAYFVAVVLIPLVFIVYTDSTGTRFGAEQIHAILQTNPAEAFGYLGTFVDRSALLKASLLAAVALFMLVRVAAMRTSVQASSMIGAVVFACATAGLLNTRVEPPYIGMFAQGVQEYFALLEEQYEASQLRAQNAGAISASKQERDELHVLVIGESASRHHFSRYGYSRETDEPLRKLDRLVWFDDAISSHTHTSASLQLALTAATVDDAGTPRYSTMPSLVEVARAAGLRTYWISNQSNLGPWDNNVAVIARGADRATFLNRAAGRVVKTAVFDDALLAPFGAALEERGSGSKFIVLHLMGSHWPYCERYPKQFDRFKEDRPPGAGDGNASTVACYDNSILYTSHLVARFIALLEARAEVASLLYLADHADDVLGMRGHDAGRFTRPMVEIPMLAWFSRKYAERYPAKVQAAARNQRQPFMSDALFHFGLDVMNVRTALLLPARSLASDSYEPRPRRTLDGRFDYDAPRPSTGGSRK